MNASDRALPRTKSDEQDMCSMQQSCHRGNVRPDNRTGTFSLDQKLQKKKSGGRVPARRHDEHPIGYHPAH